MENPEQLPAWQSHKVVRAGRIVAIGQVTLQDGKAGRSLGVEGADGNIYEARCDGEMFTRYFPVEGDFYVVYEDGYESISPAQAFTEGYHANGDQPVNLFKNGDADARQGAEEEPGLFGKRYRKLSAEELQQHDHIKDRAQALAQAIGALNPGVYARLLGVTGEGNLTGFTMARSYDGAGVTLALRHLEDAVYRAVKALTA
jgi:hypothetical protein